MTTKRTGLLPQAPPELQVPQRRFWGDREPPKDRAEMFSLAVSRSVRAATEDGAADGEAAASASGAVATLRIYGPIDSWGGWWGVSAKEVAEALDGLPDDVAEVRVRINSPGGEAFEGVAIGNLLRAQTARTVAVVDGLAASAASVVAVSCDETVMSPGTQMMIHDASAFAWGSAAAMRKAATRLDSVSDAIADVYAGKAGGSAEQWREVMVEEAWYTAAEAVAAGLADRSAVIKDAGETSTAGDEPDLPEVEGLDDVDDAVEDRFDLSFFAHAGRSHAPAPPLPPASAAGSTSTTTQERSSTVAFSDEQLTTMRQRLGVAADADEATILAALEEALNERAEPSQTASHPAGTVLVDEQVLAQMRADAAAGRAARDEQLRLEREQLVEAAVADGRIPPARREHWQSQLAADPGAAVVLAGLAKGTVPVEARGHDGAPETGSDEYELLYGKEG